MIDRMKNSRLPALDWLRAVAVTAVVVGHARTELAPGGAVGVSVFFVLSGYLICSILMREGMLTASNILKFILRRIGRIYPMYVAHIAALSVFLILFHGDKWRVLEPWLLDLLTFKAFVTDWVGYGVGVLWTLTVEFWFYLSFPFVLLAIKHFPAKTDGARQLLLGFAMIGAGSFVASALPFTAVTPGYYDHFLLGAAAAVIADSRALARFAKPGTMAIGFLIILVMTLIPYPGDRNLYWHLQSLTAGFGAFLVILASRARPQLYQLEPIAFIGRISFSMYLVHALLLDMMAEQVQGSYARLAFYLLAVGAISAVTYRYIERPTNAFVHRHIRFDSPRISLAYPQALSRAERNSVD